MRELEPGLCCEMVSDHERWPTYSQCKRKIVVTRDGKGYCTIHDPEYIKAKRAKEREKWDADYAKSKQQWALHSAAADLLAELTLLVKGLEPAEKDGTMNIPGIATLNGARNAIAKAQPK